MRLGVFSLAGLLCLLGWVSFQSGGIWIVFSEFPALLTGRALDLVGKNSDLFPVMISIIFLEFLAMLLLLPILHATNTGGQHAVSDRLSKMQLGRNFASMLGFVVVEELLARWFFLGFLRHGSLFENALGFYFLFLLGNGMWTLIHLSNYEEEDRHLLMVLPQFTGGFVLTYMYLKYGLFVTILTHLGWNTLLFSVHKKEEVSAYDVIITAYYLLVASVSYCCLEHPLSDLLVWAENSSIIDSYPRAIQGWVFKDYLLANLCIAYSLSIVAECLLLDDPEVEETDLPLTYHALGIIIFVAVAYMLYWISGWIFDGFMLRAASVALLLLCSTQGRSGSSVARTFWIGLPSMYMAICTYEALGFLLAACYIATRAIVAWVPSRIRLAQQEELG